MATSLDRFRREMSSTVRPRDESLGRHQGGMGRPDVPGRPAPPRTEEGGRPRESLGGEMETPGRGVEAMGSRFPTEPPGVEPVQAGREMITGQGPEEGMSEAGPGEAQPEMIGAGRGPFEGKTEGELMREMDASPFKRAEMEDREASAEAKSQAEEQMVGIRQERPDGSAVTQIEPGKTLTEVPGKPAELRSEKPIPAEDMFSQLDSGDVGKVVTPVGEFSKDAGGRKTWNPSPRAMEEARLHTQRVFSKMQFPGSDDPKSPRPNIFPGEKFFDPFSGRFIGGDGEFEAGDRGGAGGPDIPE